MSTALAKPSMGGSLISRDALKQSLGNIAREMPKIATGGVDFLKMDKSGEWSYGVDGTVVDEESIWAINPATLEHGWIAWGKDLGNEPLGEVMVSAMRPLPDKDSLDTPKEGNGWIPQYGVELLCISGPDEGAHVLYKNTSVGSIKLFNKYIDELMNRVESDSDELVALVNITSESYIHKKFGKTFNPVLNYIEWREPDDVSAPEAAPAKEEPKVEAKAARSRKPKAEAPAPEPEVQDDEVDETETDTAPAVEDEDEDDRLIREALERKKAKLAAAEAETETEAEATPRRRARR